MAHPQTGINANPTIPVERFFKLVIILFQIVYIRFRPMRLILATP